MSNTILHYSLDWELDKESIDSYDDDILELIDWLDNKNNYLVIDFEWVISIDKIAISKISDWCDKMDIIDSEIVIIWANDDINNILSLAWINDISLHFDNIEEFEEFIDT